MRKFLETEINEEYKKSFVTTYALCFLTFALCILTRTYYKSIFHISFYFEVIFLFAVFRFYIKAHRNKNYAFWGLTLIIGLYLLKNILNFTFVEYDIFILYIGFLAALFLGVNAFVLSSPLYYPRVQWWEYDFRYRGDLKARMKIDNTLFEGRIADLRRSAISFLAFDVFDLGAEVEVEMEFENQMFTAKGVIKTMREVIPGRPIRYGIKVFYEDDLDKKHFLSLKKHWLSHKKAKIRKKFLDYKESSELSED